VIAEPGILLQDFKNPDVVAVDFHHHEPVEGQKLLKSLT
jgi:hypothetical protein